MRITGLVGYCDTAYSDKPFRVTFLVFIIFMSGNIVRFKMDRVLKLKETESIAVPAMTDYLSVGNNAAGGDNVNSHTYVYEPNKSLHQVSYDRFLM